MNKQSNIEEVRHSLSHLLAAAVLKKYPKTKLGIGPIIENGFYYDFLFQKPISDADLADLEKEMRHLIAQKLDFKAEKITTLKAKKILAGQKFKLELIKELAKAKSPISIYRTGDVFLDLCKGPHVKNTSEINLEGFKLTHIAGAYWKGNEKNPMLTRIYGLAFATKKELDEHLKMIEEAKKRDHRKLGKELDLFHIDEKVGLGLPLWHPKGAILWRVIEDFWYKKHLENGYQLVRSPHIGNKILWETSGHWGFYNSSMYPPLEVGQTLEERQKNKKVEISEEYLLKPMNCPFHVQIYKNSPKSYRELSFRWAECGTVYRFEKKGELSGLTRVRGFTQDDAHIICRKDQVEEELKRVIDFILFIYKAFGFDIKSVNVYLSLRDPKNKEKYAGSGEGWNFTENVLRKIAREKNLSFVEQEGEAAFYGPKLDFKIKDALGREWQCSTLQFDFNLPERFDLTFINNEGKEERPYMLHRALFGSFERFIGLLIEHYAGAFPTWLAPIQAMILPISEKHSQYAENILKDLIKLGIRAEINNSNETLGKRIRAAEMQKIPYILVTGDQEIENKTVAVREREKGNRGEMSIKDFAEMIKKQIPD
ncbi:MAG: threonine--tRNA ligase [Patescibacteria group bacterium]|nr:threonine--tRNA ligase [Patescibacteria group bacterium]